MVHLEFFSDKIVRLGLQIHFLTKKTVLQVIFYDSQDSFIFYCSTFKSHCSNGSIFVLFLIL